MSRVIPMVNERDEIIGYKPSDDVTKGEIYRVSALWVTNSNGDILLAQRGLHESHDPGRWGPAVAGTVEKDESYYENVLKEAGEEIGLTGTRLTKAKKQRVSEKYDYFTQWYTAMVDTPAEEFNIQKEELEQVRWFGREELARELRDHPERYLDLHWALAEL